MSTLIMKNNEDKEGEVSLYQCVKCNFSFLSTASYIKSIKNNSNYDPCLNCMMMSAKCDSYESNVPVIYDKTIHKRALNYIKLKNEINRKGFLLISNMSTFENAASSIAIKCNVCHDAKIYNYKARYVSKRIKEGKLSCIDCVNNETYIKIKECIKRYKCTLISKNYKKSDEKYEIQCNICENIFYKTYASIKESCYCLCQNRNVGERIARLIFEKLFGVTFSPYRCPDLLGMTGKGLEIDGYNEEVGIAFEYDGKQHYDPDHIYNIKGGKFEHNKVNDKIKNEYCQRKGITLFRLPEKKARKGREDIIDTIIEVAKEIGSKLPHIIYSINIEKFEIVNNDDLLKLRKHLQNDGAVLLTPIYLGIDVDHNYTCGWCRDTHSRTPELIYKSKSTCLAKSYKDRSIKKKIDITKELDAICLKKKLIYSRDKLGIITGSDTLICVCNKHGHTYEWSTTYRGIKRAEHCCPRGGELYSAKIQQSDIDQKLEALDLIIVDQNGEPLDNFIYENSDQRFYVKHTVCKKISGKPRNLGNINSAKHACTHCAKKNVVTLRLKKAFDEKAIPLMINMNILNLTEWTGWKKNKHFMCLLCEKTISMTLGNIERRFKKKAYACDKCKTILKDRL